MSLTSKLVYQTRKEKNYANRFRMCAEGLIASKALCLKLPPNVPLKRIPVVRILPNRVFWVPVRTDASPRIESIELNLKSTLKVLSVSESSQPTKVFKVNQCFACNGFGRIKKKYIKITIAKTMGKNIKINAFFLHTVAPQ